MTDTASGRSQIQATLLLCDFAQEIAGKLYVIGGGWSRVTVGPERRINNIGLAVKLLIPWDLANRQHEMVARLVNEDGQPVIYEGNLVEVRGSIEVGRPPGLKPGTDLDAPMALNFQGLQLASGRFTWELLVDGSSLARATFEVIGP